MQAALQEIRSADEALLGASNQEDDGLSFSDDGEEQPRLMQAMEGRRRHASATDTGTGAWATRPGCRSATAAVTRWSRVPRYP